MDDWSDDIYFDENYGISNEKLELGKSEHFELDCPYGKIISTFIKRKIPLQGIDGDWYDLRTPYGYGGPLIVYANDKKKLLDEYESTFTNYCKRNNIITEFVRFHPIANNALDFNKIYDVHFDRHTVGTNMTISETPIETEFSKGCRKNIKKALNKGLSFSYEQEPQDLTTFMKVYYDTMDRNNASDFYYFDEQYFENLLKFFSKKILVIYIHFENKIVAAGLYFISHETIHIHLSGTLTEYLHLNPPYILRYAVAQWALSHSIKYLHHGGGRTSSDEDSLYRFKKQFGVNTDFDFYIGEKVWNKEMYNIVCQQKLPDENVNGFIRRMKK